MVQMWVFGKDEKSDVSQKSGERLCSKHRLTWPRPHLSPSLIVLLPSWGVHGLTLLVPSIKWLRVSSGSQPTLSSLTNSSRGFAFAEHSGLISGLNL